MRWVAEKQFSTKRGWIQPCTEYSTQQQPPTNQAIHDVPAKRTESFMVIGSIRSTLVLTEGEEEAKVLVYSDKQPK